MGLFKAFDPSVSYMDVTHRSTPPRRTWTTRRACSTSTCSPGCAATSSSKADKMTMANSLELRVPFLDVEVLRVASSIPTSEKLTKERPSTHCAERSPTSIPPHVLERAKLGFPVPIRHWLPRRCTTGRGRSSPSRRPMR